MFRLLEGWASCDPTVPKDHLTVKPGKGVVCAVASPTWNSPKMAIDSCALAMLVWFLKEGLHKGDLPQPWPFAGLAGIFSHSEHMEYSSLNSCSLTGHVQNISLLKWWAFSYPQSLPCHGIGWIVIKPALNSISEKKVDRDSEAFHNKSWFPVIMAHFWTSFSSFYSDFVSKTRHNTPGCHIG